MDKKKPSVFTESLLNYQLSTDPSPVLISPQPGEGAELYTSFQIRVTPKSSDTVVVSKLYFILSLGNSETDISSSDEASSFSVSDDSNWQFIRLSPGLYQASPAGGKDRERIGKEGIVFNIYNLPVNPEVKSTVITVKEESYGTSGSLIKSSVELPIGTSSFVKDFYFENFIAEKPVIELHGKAVLKWIGSDNAGYLLYSSNEPWNPPLDVSKQRTWSSPPLTQNTIFVLTASQVVNGETKRRDLSVMVIVKGGAENNNIYTIDGTLTGNRTVTQNTNTLAFKGSAVNAFSVDGKTFSVDAKNNRIGVGTDEPTKKLHVEGSSLFNGRAQIGELQVLGSSDNPGRIISHRGLRFTTGATENATDMIIKVDGKVGVGTDSPTNVLHVNSSTKGAIRIVDGTQGADKVLTSDASGVATWKAQVRGANSYFGVRKEMEANKSWEAKTDGIFMGIVILVDNNYLSSTRIFGFVEDTLMGVAVGRFSAATQTSFSFPVRKGETFSSYVKVDNAEELTTHFWWIPIVADEDTSSTIEYIGEFTGGDGVENDMIVVEEDSFSYLFSKTMEKLMEDVPKEQREAKMERIVKKLMEG